MKVTVISAQAIIAGRENVVWTGELFIEGEPASESQTNEAIFRLLNRVEDGDDWRLSQIGYRLPSLSVGDLIHWDQTTWRVAGQGFERIDADTLARAVMFG